MTHNKCRFCSEILTETFLDLGTSPLANSFLNEEKIKGVEKFYPLHVFVCKKCLLVQLAEFESPEHIFSDYIYFSSYSDTWLKHAENYVDMITKRFGFDSNTQIMEIASNDGYLLQFFKKKNMPVLGIEPAANVARIAEEKGIPTVIKFFGRKTATELIQTEKQADLLIGNNVLAHVPDLNDFVAGMKIVLKPKGVITIEFPHILQLMQHKQFDTIYHEHFSYFSLLVLLKVFSFHKLIIFDVDEITTHGGSLRIYVKHMENDDISTSERVNAIIEKERDFGLEKLSTYTNFQNQINDMKKNICEFFNNIKKNNKTIVGYGAPAKGNTLLNFCNIGLDEISYIVDKNPYKQGLYLPGTHIPIRNPEEILKTKPDYLLILPWNLKDEIMLQMTHIRKWEGKFVVLIPEVKIYL